MSTPSEFSPLHTIKPIAAHTTTVIALHGRGSQCPEFAEDLFEGQTSAGKTLQEHLPNCKWVFPSSQERYSTVFKEEMDEWFDIYSLTDPSAREELQVEGLRDSVVFLLKLIHDEIELLDGDASRLFNMGQAGRFHWSEWMDALQGAVRGDGKKGSGKPEMCAEELDKFFKTTFGLKGPKANASAPSALSTPVLLCHAVYDEVVDIELNRQACTALEVLGVEVQSKECQDGGYWINEMRGYDDIVDLLVRNSSKQE